MEKTESKTIENSQVKKFNERVVKSRGKNPDAPTIVRRFSFIDLTAAIEASNQSKPSKNAGSKTRFKMTATKEKNWVIPNPDALTIETMSGSIRRFINECHPDVQKFINKGEIKSVKAGAGEMTINTKNGMRVVISVEGARTRRIKITQGKKVLFDNSTTVRIEREEKLDNKAA